MRCMTRKSDLGKKAMIIKPKPWAACVGLLFGVHVDPILECLLEPSWDVLIRAL